MDDGNVALPWDKTGGLPAHMEDMKQVNKHSSHILSPAVKGTNWPEGYGALKDN